MLVDEIPEVAVEGYVGVGRFTRNGGGSGGSLEESLGEGDEAMYRAMVKDGRAMADEYGAALGSARRDAESYEKASQAQQAQPSSRELLEYRADTFRYESTCMIICMIICMYVCMYVCKYKLYALFFEIIIYLSIYLSTYIHIYIYIYI